VQSGALLLLTVRQGDLKGDQLASNRLVINCSTHRYRYRYSVGPGFVVDRPMLFISVASRTARCVTGFALLFVFSMSVCEL
jgi:hypothetical protein